jgi:hypothetical protein
MYSGGAVFQSQPTKVLGDPPQSFVANAMIAPRIKQR